MKRTIVIGAGPAGLTAAYELVKKNKDMEVIVFEESNNIGGISRTVNYKGNRMDMGGHRFFSKIPEVNEWWENILPMQAAPAYDYKKLGIKIPLADKGPDPETEDRTMLIRHRVSRIFFNKNFYDYPISLKPETFKNFGFLTTVKVGFSYLISVFHKLPENNLENLYINSFGRELYSMFFENYTENLWGRHPSDIDASWGRQRTKGLSIFGIVKNYLEKTFKVKNRKVNTSLIEEFRYPKLGPGQLWEVTAGEIEKMGGRILLQHRVSGVIKNEKDHLTGVKVEHDGIEEVFSGDYIISSMPVRDLVAGMNDVPKQYAKIAEGLPYRDYITVGVLVHRLSLRNMTDIKTIGNIIPDNWVYVQDKGIHMGRFQIYNNWSPYMIKDIENTVWLGLEYFCCEGDEWWNMSEDEFADFAIRDMICLGLISDKSEVLDYHEEKVKKAYPAYFDTYDRMDELVGYLNSIDNLYCVGRNGQHRYNNTDHSMVTSFEAVKCILTGNHNKEAIWSVNTEKVYHEEKNMGKKSTGKI